jgi:glycerol-1-phosphate dehydrogenase [NAD(P)+]
VVDEVADGRVIADLVAGRWRDPATGRSVRVPTHAVVIERSLAGAEAELVAALRLGRRLAVVADRNTFDALGQRVARALARIATIEEVVLARIIHQKLAGAEQAVEIV